MAWILRRHGGGQGHEIRGGVVGVTGASPFVGVGIETYRHRIEGCDLAGVRQV